MEPERRYSAMEILSLTGITYRMLNHLCETGRVPGYVAPGSGQRREFSQAQVDAIVRWVRARRLSKIIGALPESVLDDIERLVAGQPVSALDQAV